MGMFDAPGFRFVSLGGFSLFDNIVAHPENAGPLADAIRAATDKMPYNESSFVRSLIKVRISEHVPRFGRRYIFPRDRFVEYTASDVAWAEPVRFGGWGDDESVRVAFLIPSVVVGDFGSLIKRNHYDLSMFLRWMKQRC